MGGFMSTIYLIRHGETKWNLEERFQGITNTELTEKGMQQGKQLAERFKNKNKEVEGDDIIINTKSEDK